MKPYTFFTLSALILFSFFSCRKELDSVQALEFLVFSTDTVFFDTVFTSIGSATQVFLVKNTSNDILKIEEIHLSSGPNSFYMMNFDGVANHIFEDIELAPKDSMYVFAEVLIDPNSSETPFVVKDSIVFKSGGKQKDIKLISWGRNGIFHRNESIKLNTTWTQDQPHIIFNDFDIQKGAKLTIQEGTQIYGHAFSRINVWRGGAIEVSGSVDNPVVFQGDRLGQRYKDVAGQWIGIRIRPGALTSSFNHTVIKNGFIGLQVDSMPVSGEVNVLIHNTTITTMNLYGILAYTGSIQAVNTEITNCCEYLFAAQFGGNYRLYYCTLGNFQKNCVRTTGSLLLSNASFEDEDKVKFINHIDFTMVNSIVYGGQDEELEFFRAPEGEFNLAISHCLLKTELDELLDVSNNILNQNPKFKNTVNLDYQLDTLSPAIGKALVIPEIPTDYKGNLRSSTTPDLGAFERQE